MTFHLDRSFLFDREPAVVWDVLSRPQDYPKWWTWLRRIEGGGLTAGSVAHCYVRAPIPFALRVDLHVDAVEPLRRVDVRIDGDLQGTGSLHLAERNDGRATAARLIWDVEPAQRLMRAAGRLARPALRFGQDWAVTTGVTQFRRRALT